MIREATVENCSLCDYFEKFDLGTAEQDVSRGTCRRFPPKAGEQQQTLWPTVRGDDWCGEYK